MALDDYIPPVVAPPNTDYAAPIPLNPNRRFNAGDYPAPSLVDATGLPSATALGLPGVRPLRPGAGEAAPSAPNPVIPPDAADVTQASDIGAAADTNPPVGPVLGQWLHRPIAGTQTGIDVFQPGHRALMQPPGNYQQAPSYAQASTDPNTGLPTAAGPQTKLGKLLSILRGAGMGALAGSTQPTAGTGFLAANQFFDQQAQQNQRQQLGAAQLQMARENLQYMPLQRAWQLSNMQQNALLNRQYQEARTEELRQRSEKEAAQTQRQGQLQRNPPFQVGDRMMRSPVSTDDPASIGPNGYVDVGPAAPKGTPEQQAYDSFLQQGKTPQEALSQIAQTRQESKATTPEQDAFQAAYNEQIQKGKTPTEANAIARGQQPATGNAPMVAPQALEQRLNQLPLEVQTGLRQFAPDVQQALLALADGDANASAWSSRGTYKNTGGLTQAQAIGWARAINPAWNEQLYGDRQKLYQDYQSTKAGTAGGNIRSFNDFLLHAGQAADVTDKWRQKFLVNGSPLINTPMNKLRNRLLGDPDYTDFVTALEPVKKEYQAFLNNNRAEHTADLDQMQVIVSPDSTPAQIEAALKRMADTAVLRLDSLDQGFVQGTGGKQFPNLIHPAVRQSAGVAKLGIGERLARYQSGGYMPGYAAPQAAPAQAAPTAPAAKPPAGLVPM